jgi:hypothetical protein
LGDQFWFFAGLIVLTVGEELAGVNVQIVHYSGETVRVWFVPIRHTREEGRTDADLSGECTPGPVFGAPGCVERGVERWNINASFHFLTLIYWSSLRI